MAKLHFQDYNPKQIRLFPERLDQNIAKNDPVRILDRVVDGLRLDNFSKLYSVRGRSPYHPKMMLKVVLYAYMSNVYSCRKIEERVRRDVHFIWLAGGALPDFNTINRFRNRVKDEINEVFTQLVVTLVEKGFVTLDVEYVDGTKIESCANRYTFVWRKATERHRANLLDKIKALLKQIDDADAQATARESERESPTPDELRQLANSINQALEAKAQDAQGKEAKKETKGEAKKGAKKEAKKMAGQLLDYADKLEEYDRHLEIMGLRNSYSKTDHDATFMRMKDDAMHNGQTKPGYNLQIGSQNQFITDFGIFQSPGDTLTMIPFLESYRRRYGRLPRTCVADSGYGSEENYRFMEEAGMEAYVKYSRFHIEHRPRYVPPPFAPQSLFYNADGDFLVCPMGQRMARVGTALVATDSGYVAERARYRARRCEGCPLRGQCFSGQSERVVEVNRRLAEYRRKAADLLTSPEGLMHRGRRCVEPEAIFGQMKYNMAYKRFRHFGLDKVKMDFTFFAIAFNIKKMCSKVGASGRKGGGRPFLLFFFCHVCVSVDLRGAFSEKPE